MVGKAPQNELKPMSVTQVIGYDVKKRKSKTKFLKDLANKRK